MLANDSEDDIYYRYDKSELFFHVQTYMLLQYNAIYESMRCYLIVHSYGMA